MTTSKVILPYSKVIYFACRSYGSILEKKRENGVKLIASEVTSPVWDHVKVSQCM